MSDTQNCTKFSNLINSCKNIKLDGSNPTMLYAYGGFNINIMPSYDPLAAFFINNLNGVYALANIRGGGYEKINIWKLIIKWSDYMNEKYAKNSLTLLKTSLEFQSYLISFIVIYLNLKKLNKSMSKQLIIWLFVFNCVCHIHCINKF